MSTLPSPNRNGADAPLNFYTSNKSFAEKVKIPPRSMFIGSEDVYLTGDIQIRRHNGLFWKSYKTKATVLLKSGRLFIYSSSDTGITVNLFDLRVKIEYSEKDITAGQDVISKCEVVLQMGKSCLGVCVKGTRNFVTAWRRGFSQASDGISLRDAKDTDEITWSQDQVDPTASEEVLMSMAACSLRANSSMPSLGLFYHSTTLPHMKKYNDVISFMKSSTIGTKKKNTKGTLKSISFYPDNTSSEIARNNEVLMTDGKMPMCVNGQTLAEIDSGISSPTLEENVGTVVVDSGCVSDESDVADVDATHSTSKNEPCWHPSRLDGIPMLSSSILCFDKAFPLTLDDH